MSVIVVVDRDGSEHIVEAKPAQKMMEVLRELPYGVPAICGGLCACATCHVYVGDEWFSRLPPPQDDEIGLLKELPEFRAAQSRLSCQVEFTAELSGIKVTLAPEG